MTKRKKRSAVTLVSLLLALSALIGVYIWYNGRSTTTDDSSENTDTTSLATIDTSKAVALHFTGADVDISLSLKDGVWMSDSEPERPINQDVVKSILDTMSDIKATQTVTDKPEDLAEYGLKEPVNQVSITLEGGKEVSLSVGDQLVSEDSYYAMVNGSTTVYVVDSNYAFGYNDSNFTAMETAPTISKDNITYISVDNRDSEDVEIKKIDTDSIDNCGAVMYKWRILKPYGEGYSADSAAVGDIEANYTAFSFLSCADYSGKDLSKYGLDNPASVITLNYKEAAATPTSEASADKKASDTTAQPDKVFRISIGNKDDQGNYYVKTGGSSMVYTMSGDAVDKMLAIDVFKIMTPYVNLPNLNNVDRITADVAGKTYTMEVKRTASTDKKDSDVKEEFSYNGNTVDEQLFRDVYKKLITPRYDSFLADKVDTATLAPVMTISFHVSVYNGQTNTTTFYPYDKSFYIVDKGTGVYFLTDKRAVDDMVAAISTFKVEK